ncbi:TVP38/TMEM64 family protein [Thioalkalivibrio sp. ALJ16]|uniref:TVP38/TMEM64 family protein n=1 Tax=Thioalkalivibrio sp. ALJ16 TaxID=1158762 RepID=UPI0003633CEA|nr:TVP38/TMEM64 family protein [Thioalkalivibrio sp. ALJ16]
MYRYRWWWLALLALAGLVILLVTDAGRLLELERLQAAQARLLEWREARPLAMGVGFFLLYVLVAALSVPGIVIMTLAGGAIFGAVAGTVLSSVASTLGATLTFLLARSLARAPVQRRFGHRLQVLDRGFREEGAFYLFALRITPVLPFAVVNAGMGLVPIRAWTYFWVSLLGMLPATALFAFAGTQLAQLGSTTEVISVGMLAALTAIGLFPLLARRIVRAWRRRAVRHNMH